MHVHATAPSPRGCVLSARHAPPHPPCSPSPWLLPRRSSSTSTWTARLRLRPPCASPSDEAIQARIAAARRYKQQSSSAPPSTTTTTTTTPASPPPPAPTSPPPGPATSPPAPVDYSAMTAFLQSPRGSRSPPAADPVLAPGPLSPPAPPPNGAAASSLTIQGIVVAAPSPPAASPAAEPDQQRQGERQGSGRAEGTQQQQQEQAEQDQRQQQQKQQQQPEQASASSAPDTSSSSAAVTPPATVAPASAPAVPFLERAPDPALPSPELVQMIMSAPQGPGRGSATEPAAFLAGVFSSTDNEAPLDPNMRMEEFTTLKQERMKQLGAEIITVDQNYNPGARPVDPALPADSTVSASASTAVAPEPLYQPKVSTWGAFPRPSDISKAYGGGRNIKPGQELETKEQAAAREAQYASALRSYREKVGLEVDPELEEAAEKLYLEGMVLFEAGDLRASYSLFDRATEMVPLRTRVGGLATLQKAVVLDSTGNSEEAKKLYKKLRGHAVSSVSRKARQLAYGFEAAVFLKADQISYAAKKSDYVPYFRRFADRNKVYIATEADRARDAELNRMASAVAVAVLLGPIALIASLVATR